MKYIRRERRDPAKDDRDSRVKWPALATKTPKSLCTVRLGRSLTRRRPR